MADMSSIIGASSGMFYTVFRVIIIIVVCIALFFASRWYFGNRKKMKNFKITSFISNPDGSHFIWKTGKFKDKDGMQKMLFAREVPLWFGLKKWEAVKDESMPVINPSHIVSNSVHLFRYGSGQYSVIPPTVYRQIDVKKFGIQLINMHMLEFKGLEQRADISRWAAMKKSLQEWAPWITLGVLAIVCGSGIFFMMKFGMAEFARVTAARVAECQSLIGGGSAPVA